MMKKSAQFLRSVGFFVSVAVCALSTVGAQTFPARPITIVVPFPPGGPTDSSARLVGKSLGSILKQAVVIENRPGAGGTTGSTYVARGTADGYTLLWGSTSSLGVAPTLYPKLGYAPLTSFAPLGMVARSPIILAGRGDMAANTLKEFIALSREKKLSYGSAGSGSINHLVGEWFKNEANVDMLHVPYKGGLPALNDLLGGQIDMVFETIPTVSPFLKSERLKVLATAGRSRSALLPNVPTVREVIGGNFEAYSWVGLVAPANTPPETLKILSDAMRTAENDPLLQAEIAATGLEPVKSSPEKFRQDIESELAKWTRLVLKVKPTVD